MPIISSSLEHLAEELFAKISMVYPEIDIEKLRRAYEFAKKAHQGQLRRSGEPYMIHPIRTAKILLNLRVDEDTLIAAFLHDVPEDTNISIADIKQNFGEKISYLVDGVTKLSKVYYHERMEQRQIESLKKMFIHSAADLRVILIKLADRLDNMRSLRFIADDKKRIRIAKETLDIYVPIANLLGIGEIRAELEDLCFEYLHPVDYSNLKREVEENTEERNFILEEMIRLTEKDLQKHKMEAEIIGRPKTLYSIFKKLQVRQTIYNIDDLIAIRVIVPTRKDCYETLGIIHRLFKPKPGHVKDYIAVPKPNGYQSLHTTVFGLNGSTVEFQIRTKYMHLEAEYGIAAHYFYKYANEQELAAIMQQRSSWVQRVLEIQKDQDDPHHFLENLRLDVFHDRIFVFSPKGDVIDLPRGACVLDFAYAIHTEIGNRATKAEINGASLPIFYALGSGDTVHVITDKNIKPEREWLNFVKTSFASNKIKEQLKKEPLENKLTTGKKYIQKEFDRIGKNYIDELTGKRIKLIGPKLNCKTLEDILVGIAEGIIKPQNVIELIYGQQELNPRRIFKRKDKMMPHKGFLSRIGLRVIGDNGKNQFREITRTLNAFKIPIVKFIVDRPFYLSKDRCRFSVLVKNYNELSQIFESLEHLDGVEKITRTFTNRKIWFSIASLFTLSIWLLNPLILQTIFRTWPSAETISDIVIFGGILMLFGLVFYLKNTARRSFPELAETKYFWGFLYLLNTLAFYVIFWELLSLKLHFNWIVAVIFIVAVYAWLTASYISFRREQS